MESSPVNADGVGPLPGPDSRPQLTSEAKAPSFKEMLGRYLDEVNALQEQADTAARDLAVGKTANLHEVIVAISEADLSFRLMMQMRNKLVEAYKEIMRMQV